MLDLDDVNLRRDLINGGDPDDLMAIMGWESREMLRVYGKARPRWAPRRRTANSVSATASESPRLNLW
jgi:hypothetical protein